MMFRRGGDASGLKILPHKGIVHRVIDALKAGEAVVVLADQRGDDNRPVWVDFFGRKVLANGVFARFATDGDAYCFPVMGLRTDAGRYYCEFGNEIPIQVSDNRSDDIMVNSQLFHDIFEQWLREHPEQGFWMHRKFKRKRKSRKKQAVTYRPSLAQQKSQEVVPAEGQVMGHSAAQR
jgi:KDO2-lipid IV(A) lauroyltransferase